MAWEFGCAMQNVFCTKCYFIYHVDPYQPNLKKSHWARLQSVLINCLDFPWYQYFVGKYKIAYLWIQYHIITAICYMFWISTQIQNTRWTRQSICVPLWNEWSLILWRLFLWSILQHTILCIAFIFYSRLEYCSVHYVLLQYLFHILLYLRKSRVKNGLVPIWHQ